MWKIKKLYWDFGADLWFSIAILSSAPTQSNSRGNDKVSQWWLHQISTQYQTWQHDRIQQTNAEMWARLLVYIWFHELPIAIYILSEMFVEYWHNFKFNAYKNFGLYWLSFLNYDFLVFLILDNKPKTSI